MRRSDHPSRPSAITCCRFSALKTLPIPAAGVQPTAQVNVSAPGAALAGFQVSINGRFWVSTEGATGPTGPVSHERAGEGDAQRIVRARAGIAPRYDALERKGVSLPGRARRVAD